MEFIIDKFMRIVGSFFVHALFLCEFENLLELYWFYCFQELVFYVMLILCVLCSKLHAMLCFFFVVLGSLDELDAIKCHVDLVLLCIGREEELPITN